MQRTPTSDFNFILSLHYLIQLAIFTFSFLAKVTQLLRFQTLFLTLLSDIPFVFVNKSKAQDLQQLYVILFSFNRLLILFKSINKINKKMVFLKRLAQQLFSHLMQLITQYRGPCPVKLQTKFTYFGFTQSIFFWYCNASS